MENFTVLYHQEGHVHIQIPKLFVIVYGHSLKNPLLVTASNGIVWNVEFASYRGEVWLTMGWDQVHDFVFIALNAKGELNIKVVKMNADNVINTNSELRAGMTIGVIERPRGATGNANCRVEDGDSHMGLFDAVDYVVAMDTDEKRKGIQLPLDFTSRWGSVLRSRVLITTCDNIQHEVSYYTDQYGEIRLGAEWRRIAKDFNLGVYDALLFSYNGNSLFDLTMFSLNCHGKTRTPKSAGDFPINIYTMFMYDCFREKLVLPSWCGINYWMFMENPINICIADGSVFTVRWVEVEGSIWFDEGWKDVVSHCSFKYADDLFMVMKNRSEIELRVVRRASNRVVKAVDYISSTLEIDRNFEETLMESEGTSCRTRTLEEETEWSMENEEELWKSSITDSRKEPNRPLYIPAQAVRCYFADKPAKIKVMQPSGEVKEWSFIWTYVSGKKAKIPCQCHFGAGWYNFVATNNLPKGQHMRFFRRRGEDFIRLEITL